MKIIEKLLIMRQTLIKFYKSYEYIAWPILKFIGIYIAISVLMTRVEYQGVLSHPILILFMSLIGAVLPNKGILLSSVVLVPLCVFKLNPILASILFMFLAILYLTFMRLFPKESLWIIITVVAFCLKMEILVPFVTALLCGYVSGIAMLIGVFIWYLIPNLAEALSIAGTDKEAFIQMLQGLININLKGIIANQTMLSMLIIFLVVFTTVYIIRRMSIDYSHYIAIGIGGVMNAAGFTLAKLFFATDIRLTNVLFITLIYMLVAVVIEFFSNVLDYERAEVLSFEDDENFYHVKVIPKMYLNTATRKVKRVYSSKSKVDKEAEIKQNITQEGKDTSL